MALDTSAVIDGKYQIVRLLGEGGMGAVYEGLNVRIHRKVAIKVLHGNVAGNADAVHRFEREAQAAGRIGSKHIVEVLDMGDLPNGDRYMVMEFLAGVSLSDRIKERGQMTPQELCPLITQLLEGLAAAHAAGIVHRDLKPDNVYLLPSDSPNQPDFVKILDFGISKFNVMGGEFSMTRTGAVMGTPYYMSPEQAKGDPLDQRTDLYAVGVILYEAMSGRVPFNAETFNQLLFKIVLEEAPPLESLVGSVNPAFLEIVRKSMARNPADRYQTASDFKAALQNWARRDSIVPLGIPDPTPGYGTSLPSKTIAQGSGTSPAWSKTQGLDALPVKKSSPLVPLAAAAVILLAGAGYYFKSTSDKADAEAALQARAEADRKVEEEKKKAAEQLAAQQREAEATALKLKELEAAQAKAKELAEAKAATTTKPTTGSPNASGTASSGSSASAGSTTPAKPVAAKPTTATAPPPEKKPASTGTTTSTGRSIRSTL